MQPDDPKTSLAEWQEKRAEALADIFVDGFLTIHNLINESKGRPIPVTERLPEDGQHCLVFFNGNFDNGGCWHDAIFRKSENQGNDHCLIWHGQGPMKWFGKDATHWLPLPPNP